MCHKIKYLLLLGSISLISACGTGGVNGQPADDCDNQSPSKTKACEVKVEKEKGNQISSNWDNLQWNNDNWN